MWSHRCLDMWFKSLEWSNRMHACERRSLICLWFASLSFHLSHFHHVLLCIIYTRRSPAIRFYQRRCCCRLCCCCLLWCMMTWLEHGTLLVKAEPIASFTEIVNEWTTLNIRSVRQKNKKHTCIVGKSQTSILILNQSYYFDCESLLWIKKKQNNLWFSLNLIIKKNIEHFNILILYGAVGYVNNAITKTKTKT